MTKSFKSPRVEGDFTATGCAPGTSCGAAPRASVDRERLRDVTKARRHAAGRRRSRPTGGSRSAIPRKDGGEEINARVRSRDRPMRDLRHAFELDDWPLDGQGVGRVPGCTAGTRGRSASAGWRSRTARPTASRSNARPRRCASRARACGSTPSRSRRAAGTVTGAAYVGWDGPYSFNARGDRIPVESWPRSGTGRRRWPGLLRFRASGARRSRARATTSRSAPSDLFLGEEGIGEVAEPVRRAGPAADVESSRRPASAVSGTGRIAMTRDVDAELSFRFTGRSLDPYVRLFEPRLSPFTRPWPAAASASSASWRTGTTCRSTARSTQLDMRLFDYQLRNDGPIRLALDNNVVTAQQLRLVGEDTRLECRAARSASTTSGCGAA